MQYCFVRVLSITLIGLLAHAAEAQTEVSVPRLWGTLGIASGISFSQKHSAYAAAFPVGGRGGIGVRLSPRYAIRVDASANINLPVEGAVACIPENMVNGRCGSDDLGLVAGGSLALAYLGNVADGIPSTTYSLGPAVYHLGGFSNATSRPTALGGAAWLEHTIGRDRVRLWSFDAGVVVLPNVRKDVVWQIPAGFGVRFW